MRWLWANNPGAYSQRKQEGDEARCKWMTNSELSFSLSAHWINTLFLVCLSILFSKNCTSCLINVYKLVYFLFYSFLFFFYLLKLIFICSCPPHWSNLLQSSSSYKTHSWNCCLGFPRNIRQIGAHNIFLVLAYNQLPTYSDYWTDWKVLTSVETNDTFGHFEIIDFEKLILIWKHYGNSYIETQPGSRIVKISTLNQSSYHLLKASLSTELIIEFNLLIAQCNEQKSIKPYFQSSEINLQQNFNLDS